MASNDNYYKFLDVSSTASQDEIRSAYRKMAFKYHPDRNRDPWAETIFKQINEAYEVLGNPSKRTAYDAERRMQARRAEESQRGARQGQQYSGSSEGRGSGYEGSGAHSSGVNICWFCGQPNYQYNRFCSNCGREPRGRRYTGRYGDNAAGPVRPAIPNYFGRAIFTTLLCFWPAGIVSLVFAARVNGKIRSGDIQGALRCSRNARIWACVSFGLGIPFFSFSALGILTNLAG